MFVIDSSGSIDHDEYSIMKDFMIDLVKKADVGKNHVRFGALKYARLPGYSVMIWGSTVTQVGLTLNLTTTRLQ